eukprot:3080788-Ditylum_brightwellii.AAC.1
MKLWADEEVLHQPLGKRYKSGNDLKCTWPKSIHSQEWSTCAVDTISKKITPAKVKTTDRSVTWQGTYCYGFTGDIIHRQPAIMDKYTSTLAKWE